MYKCKVAIRRSSQQHKASIFGVFWLIEYSYIRFKFMVGYGRFRKSRRITRSRGGMRRRSSSRRRSGLKKVFRPRFATVGFVRDTEKKYADESMVSITWLPEVISYHANPGTGDAPLVQGVKFMSQMRHSTRAEAVGNNLVSLVGGGSSAVGRIGNKIDAKWLDLGVTLEAAKSPVDQGGEQVNVEGAVVKASYYMKTVYRLVLVKDTQANNPTNVVTWGDVFGAGLMSNEGTYFGASDKLNIGNMGRFRIIKDIKVTLDADDPLKNVKMGCSPGVIRFNSPNAWSLTDKGFYLVIAQDVIGTAKSISYCIPGIVRCGVRLTFTD